MPIKRPENLAELVNLGLWSSASRIAAGYKLMSLGQGARAVPPDGARVAMALRARAIASYEEIVGLLRPLDDEADDLYRRNRVALPAGQHALQPIYDQAMVLRASPVIHPDWIWRDMPPELYLWNRPGLSAEERAILDMLGYRGAAEDLNAGREVYTVDMNALEEAKSLRAEQMSKGPWAIVAVVGALALALYAPSIIITWMETKAAREETARRHEAEAHLHARNMVRLEAKQKLLEYCLEKARAGQSQLDVCNRLAGEMGPWEDVASVNGPPPVAAGCGFWRCWPWAAGAAIAGAVAGRALVKRFGLVGRGLTS